MSNSKSTFIPNLLEPQEFQKWERKHSRWWQCCWWVWGWKEEFGPQASDQVPYWSLAVALGLESGGKHEASGKVCHFSLKSNLDLLASLDEIKSVVAYVAYVHIIFLHGEISMKNFMVKL